MSRGYCLICGGEDGCLASRRAASLLPPGTPVRVRYPASEGGATFTGITRDEPGVGSVHWFVGVIHSGGVREDGRTWAEGTASIPAEYVTPCDPSEVPADLAALPPSMFNPWGVRESTRVALGWNAA